MDASIITMAEEAIIGTMINCPGTIGIAMRDLAPADFTQLGCRGLYEAAADLFLAGSPVDAVTVLSKAGAEYKPMLDACVGHLPAGGYALSGAAGAGAIQAAAHPYTGR